MNKAIHTYIPLLFTNDNNWQDEFYHFLLEQEETLVGGIVMQFLPPFEKNVILVKMRKE